MPLQIRRPLSRGYKCQPTASFQSRRKALQDEVRTGWHSCNAGRSYEYGTSWGLMTCSLLPLEVARQIASMTACVLVALAKSEWIGDGSDVSTALKNAAVSFTNTSSGGSSSRRRSHPLSCTDRFGKNSSSPICFCEASQL